MQKDAEEIFPSPSLSLYLSLNVPVCVLLNGYHLREKNEMMPSNDVIDAFDAGTDRHNIYADFRLDSELLMEF